MATVVAAALGVAVATLEVAVATLEVAVAISVASAEATSWVAAVSAVATLLGLRGIISPAIASHNTKESTLPSTEIISTTEIISGTTDISFSEEIRFCMITHTTMGMIIRTMTIMGTMPTTISGVTYNAGDHDGQPSVGEGNTIIAVQQELTQLGYYHGPVHGQIGQETEKAIRWFQSVDKLSVTGQIDGPTLKALGLV